MDTINYVLSKFSKKELETLKPTLEISPKMIDDYLHSGVNYIMNNYNGSK